jgi:hypothetical protein
MRLQGRQFQGVLARFCVRPVQSAMRNRNSWSGFFFGKMATGKRRNVKHFILLRVIPGDLPIRSRGTRAAPPIPHARTGVRSSREVGLALKRRR